MEKLSEVPILHHIIACIVVLALFLLILNFLKNAGKAFLTFTAIVILCLILAKIYPFMVSFVIDLLERPKE